MCSRRLLRVRVAAEGRSDLARRDASVRDPLVAIALGMAFLGERPSLWTFAGAGLVIGAVYVAITQSS